MSVTTLTNLYRCTVESILSGCITAWYGSCSVQDRNKLQRAVNEAQSITQTSLSSIDTVYTSHCLRKAASIIKGPTHPGHSLCQLFPLRKIYRSLRTRTNRLENSFFPVTIRVLNGPTSHWVDLSLHCNTTFCTLSFPSLWTVCFVCIARKKQYFSVSIIPVTTINQIKSNQKNCILSRSHPGLIFMFTSGI